MMFINEGVPMKNSSKMFGRTSLAAALLLLSTSMLPGYSTAQTSGFVHPGAPLTASDLATIKSYINAGKQPWKSAYDQLAADGRSKATYTMLGPYATVGRAPDVNRWPWQSDMIAVWNLSRMWYFTGNTAYAKKAHDILLAWATTHKSFGGRESMLDLGDFAAAFVGGADILRGTWPGWTSADTATVKKYFNDVLILPKLVASLVPTPWTAAMIASAIPAAIRPYSMAVAPDSSAQNLRIVFMRSV